MDRDEAAIILDRSTTIPGDGYTYEQINEAIDMAISALRADHNGESADMMAPAHIDQEAWVSVDDHLPPEHDSIFKKFKGTDKWVDGMFESLSDDVIVSVKFGDGTKKTYPAHTTDGIWRALPKIGHPVVTHWMPFPEPAAELEKRLRGCM